MSWTPATSSNASRPSGIEEAEGSPDWTFGETLIRGSYFQDYAQEIATDCGLITSEDWPMHCIDWEQAAGELQIDYTEVEFAGIEYWIRS